MNRRLGIFFGKLYIYFGNSHVKGIEKRVVR